MAHCHLPWQNPAHIMAYALQETHLGAADSSSSCVAARSLVNFASQHLIISLSETALCCRRGPAKRGRDRQLHPAQAQGPVRNSCDSWVRHPSNKVWCAGELQAAVSRAAPQPVPRTCSLFSCSQLHLSDCSLHFSPCLTYNRPLPVPLLFDCLTLNNCTVCCVCVALMLQTH